jgi:hypothetical protein
VAVAGVFVAYTAIEKIVKFVRFVVGFIPLFDKKGLGEI